MNDRDARLALAHLVEPGRWAVHQVVAARGAGTVAAALLAGCGLPGLSRELAAAASERARGWDLGRVQQALVAAGARLLVPGDAEWPAQLDWHRSAKADAPPLSLCVSGSGHLADLAARSVAVVGARASSRYGNQVARDLGLKLAERGCAVVSGGAYGIDAEAHRGALLSATGSTVAVLASGVDVAYPRGNARLLEDVRSRGLLVSEVLPGNHPTRARFLVRNRVIAALAQGTVVVEAALRSGSLSTARLADALSRRVMAVPGPVTSDLSAGCHLLLREEGASIVTGAADVLALVGRMGEDLPTEARGETRVRDALSTAACQVLDALPVRDGIGEAGIARAVGLPVMVVQQLLPPLQIHGLVRRDETGWVLTALAIGRPQRR